MLFRNSDYSRELAGHIRPVTSMVQPSAAGCVIFCPMDWWSRSGTVHRKYTSLPRRVDRNEYYFALLYIVRQVSIPYSALQFRRNSPVFWSFEIPRMPGHKVACRACVRIPIIRGCKHWAPLWFTGNIRLPMWILSIAISIIDLNVHRWSATDQCESIGMKADRSPATVSLNVYRRWYH